MKLKEEMGFEEKMVEDIYKWVAKGANVGFEKERLLKMMIEATLDYLSLKGYFKEEKVTKKKNGKNN